MLVTDEIKHFTLRERGHLMTILTMTIEETVYFDFSIEQDEEIVLIWLTWLASSTHELDVLLQKHLLMLTRKVGVNRLLLEQSFVREE